MSCHQSIVWIDAKEARISCMEHGLHHESTINAQDAQEQPAGDGNTTDNSSSYFYQVARALDTAEEILIVGPSGTKADFVKYMHKNDYAIDPRILGAETISHPNDVQLASFAKLYFTVGGPRRAGNGSG